MLHRQETATTGLQNCITELQNCITETASLSYKTATELERWAHKAGTTAGQIESCTTGRMLLH